MFCNSKKDRLKTGAIPTGSVEGIYPIGQDNSMVGDSGEIQMSKNVAGTSRSSPTYEGIVMNDAPSFDAIYAIGMADTPASTSAGTPCEKVLSPVPGTRSTMDYEIIDIQDSDTSDAHIQTSTSLSADILQGNYASKIR